MLDKLKDLNNLRKAQSQIKKQLEQIFVKYEDGDIEILVRGDKKVEKITIDGEVNSELKDALNQAFKLTDKKVEKQMRGQMGDLGIPGL